MSKDWQFPGDRIKFPSTLMCNPNTILVMYPFKWGNVICSGDTKTSNVALYENKEQMDADYDCEKLDYVLEAWMPSRERSAGYIIRDVGSNACVFEGNAKNLRYACDMAELAMIFYHRGTLDFSKRC